MALLWLNVCWKRAIKIVREVDIVYLYEHAARELDVACAVAALLETNYGLSIEIVQWPVEFGRIVHTIRPKKMVVLPYCYVEKDFSPLLAYWRGVHYVNLTWEQLLYPGNEKAKMPRGDFVIKDVVHHAWSKYYVDSLKKNGIDNNHIFLNGQPAYTLYDKPYSSYFKSREELAQKYSLDISKKWIFFPENYNWAFYMKNRLEMFVRDGQTPEQVNTMKEFCDLSLTQVLHWFEKVIHEVQEIEIIIRPRPSTTLDEFVSVLHKSLGEIPARLHLIQDETVREWILASDVIFSSHSTSLIEAAIAGKQAYMLEPYPVPETLQAIWHQFLPHIAVYDDFVDICTKNKTVDERLANWARANLMSKGDAIRNLAYFLSNLTEIPVSKPESTVLSTRTHYPPVWVWVIYRNLRRLYFYWRTKAVEPVFVKDMVSKLEIKNRKRKWLQIL